SVHSLGDFGPEVGITPHESRGPVEHAEEIVCHENLAVAAGGSADSDGGTADLLGNLGGEVFGDPLDHHGETAGLIGRDGFGNDAVALFLRPAAGLEAAVDVRRLWPQSHMGHDGDAALDQVFHRGGGVFAGLDLHGLAADFLHDAGGVVEGLLGAGFVTAE